MFPRVFPHDLSTAIQGKLWTRSLPRIWSSTKKGAEISTGSPQVLPPSSDWAKAIELVGPPGRRRQVTYARFFSGPKRGMEPVPSRTVALTTLGGAKVGGVLAKTSSE